MASWGIDVKLKIQPIFNRVRTLSNTNVEINFMELTIAKIRLRRVDNLPVWFGFCVFFLVEINSTNLDYKSPLALLPPK